MNTISTKKLRKNATTSHQLRPHSKARGVLSKLGSLTYVGVLLMALPTPCFAYLDPGTGSLLLQGLIGAIATVLATVGIYRKKVKDFFRKTFKCKTEDNPKSN